MLKYFYGLSDGSWRRGIGGEKSPEWENTLHSLGSTPRGSREIRLPTVEDVLCWLPMCKQTWENHTVFSLYAGYTTSKAPAASNSNNGVLNFDSLPVSITYWTCTVSMALNEVSWGFAVKVYGSVLVFQGETDKYKKIPNQNQNTDDISKALTPRGTGKGVKSVFIKPPVTLCLWSWVSPRTCLCSFVHL